MKISPLVSLIIPAYNHDQYIAETIQSILEQDYPNLEIIVINDGSTDDTEVVAKNVLGGSLIRYQVISQENSGAHAAINNGIKVAQGEYLAILNSDDYYFPGRISIMVREMIKHKRRFAYSKVLHIEANGDPHSYQEQYLKQIENAVIFPTLGFELLRNNIAVTTGNFIFHRSLFDEIGDFDEFITCHDWDFILRALLVEEPIFIDQILMAYRIHSEGTLQYNLKIVNQEIEQIMLNYLENADQAKNPIAPSTKNWGDYWTLFSSIYLDRIRQIPAIQAKLDELNIESIAQGFNPLNEYVDLDLTTINLSDLSLRKTQTNKIGKHLLLIIPWMVMGGAERFVLNILDQLKKQDWQISIICTSPSENGWRVEFEKRTKEIIILPEILAVKDYPRFFRFWIDFQKIDAVFLQGSIEGYRLLPVLRGLYPEMPIIDYLHFVTPDWMNGGFPKLSVVYRDCLDRTITSCDQVKQWLIGEGVREDKLRVCPIGVDHLKWKPDSNKRTQFREMLGLNESDVVIIYAARLEAQKQPLVFLETMKNLLGLGTNFQALIAGDGSMKKEMQEFILQNELSGQIKLLGEISSEDMPGLLTAGDIFFLPSENEGISSSIYEAMSSGLPVVGADVGGQSELVMEDCGILLSNTPVQEQAFAYTQIIKELIVDEKKRRALQVSSRDRIISNFTLDQTGNNFLKILNETILEKQLQKNVSEKLSEEELFQRNSQHIIEYLQARNEWHKKNNEINELAIKFELVNKNFLEAIAPKPASHWFYLWIRQLLIPIFNNLGDNKSKKSIVKFKEWIKSLFVK